MEGFLNGIRTFDPDAKLSAINEVQDKSLWPTLEHEFTWPNATTVAHNWADIAIDLKGYLDDYDSMRAFYIAQAKSHHIHFVYGPTSFHRPDPKIVANIPAIARGKFSGMNYMGATGKQPVVAPDFAFLVEPEDYDPKDKYRLFKRSFTTARKARNLEAMERHYGQDHDCQLVLEHPSDGYQHEPKLELPGMKLQPRRFMGFVGTLDMVHTARYHPGVAAVYWDIPAIYYARYTPKIKDLEDLRGLKIKELRDAAIKGCELIWQLVNTHVKTV
jgi:hypothetical protein